MSAAGSPAAGAPGHGPRAAARGTAPGAGTRRSGADVVRVIAAAVLVAMVATVGGAASAQGRFDGSWGIEVLTERGGCEPVYRYYIVIAQNAVRVKSMMGEVSPEVAGRINPTGRIDTRIGAADDPVAIRGRLDSAAGTGTWTAPARGCGGRWVAERRG